MSKEGLQKVIQQEQANDKMQDQVLGVIICFLVYHESAKYIDFSHLFFHFYRAILFQQKICVIFLLFMIKSGEICLSIIA